MHRLHQSSYTLVNRTRITLRSSAVWRTRPLIASFSSIHFWCQLLHSCFNAFSQHKLVMIKTLNLIDISTPSR